MCNMECNCRTQNVDLPQGKSFQIIFKLLWKCASYEVWREVVDVEYHVRMLFTFAKQHIKKNMPQIILEQSLAFMIPFLSESVTNLNQIVRLS